MIKFATLLSLIGLTFSTHSFSEEYKSHISFDEGLLIDKSVFKKEYHKRRYKSIKSNLRIIKMRKTKSRNRIGRTR